jgi:ATP-dependent Clp protease ATP-binding subunit ClpA
MQSACAIAAAKPDSEWLQIRLSQELEELRHALESRVVGQEHATAEIVSAVARFRAGMAGLDRPVAAFLLLGPSGVGKTLTVEALAESLHGSPKAVLKLHCAEMGSEHELARLKGSPPGYVGWRECVPLLHESRLREVRLRDELAVVLFDEVEKAHPALWDLMLGVLDKGEVLLNDNTRSDFRRTLVFLTANVGARDISRHLAGGVGFQPAPPLGRSLFNTEARAFRSLDGVAQRASERIFSPEFRNRLTATLTYRPLAGEQLVRVAELELKRLAAGLRLRHSLSLDFEEEAVHRLVEAGYNPQYGARHLKRSIEKLVEDPVATFIVSGALEPGDRLVVCARPESEARHGGPGAPDGGAPDSRALDGTDSLLFRKG